MPQSAGRSSTAISSYASCLRCSSRSGPGLARSCFQVGIVCLWAGKKSDWSPRINKCKQTTVFLHCSCGERAACSIKAFTCACAKKKKKSPSRGEWSRKHEWVSLSSPGQGLLLGKMKIFKWRKKNLSCADVFKESYDRTCKANFLLQQEKREKRHSCKIP